MKYAILGILALSACGAPTDMTSKDAPFSIEELRVVHPAKVIVTVTPLSSTAYTAGQVQYVATARDDQGRVLKPAAWTWKSSDTTVAVVSSTGLATGRAVGQGIITATAFPPWRR